MYTHPKMSLVNVSRYFDLDSVPCPELVNGTNNGSTGVSVVWVISLVSAAVLLRWREERGRGIIMIYTLYIH